MHTTRIENVADSATTSATVANHDSSPHPYDVLLCVANEALRKARERGYEPGYERQDWLAAEREILAQAYGLTGASC